MQMLYHLATTIGAMMPQPVVGAAGAVSDVNGRTPLYVQILWLPSDSHPRFPSPPAITAQWSVLAYGLRLLLIDSVQAGRTMSGFFVLHRLRLFLHLRFVMLILRLLAPIMRHPDHLRSHYAL
ncbi:hypothetical protein [Paenibacillus sp. SYP-B4298]|uniref:hypothetical protein n=1 Tax=Paenibacillus sp. SYP-B4298 TaxID=2996034 RepID=UPI0022DD1DC7|nr:hypothetical protein [Paenibacillus sp. SYP-B4298]